MNIRQLKSLVTFHEEGSFAAANKVRARLFVVRMDVSARLFEA